MIAGIAVDDWKVDIFKKLLDADSYNYTDQPGLVKGTRLLKVNTLNINRLKRVIIKAETEAAKSRPH